MAADFLTGPVPNTGEVASIRNHDLTHASALTSGGIRAGMLFTDVSFINLQT